MSVYIFSGQGTQKKGMASDLFYEFSDISLIANDVLGYSIKDLCLQNPFNLLDKTEFTQAALFTVNAMRWLALNPSSISALAGHSLGEINALFAADVFDFKTGLTIVKRRAELMGTVRHCGLAVINGLSTDQIVDLLSYFDCNDLEIANINSGTQIVIGGSHKSLDEFLGEIRHHSGVKLAMKLPVSGAFHTRLYENAAKEFREFIEPIPFNPIKFPVVSNLTAQFHTDETLKNALATQICSTVEWYKSMQFLEKKGLTDFREVGGKVLTKIIERSDLSISSIAA